MRKNSLNTFQESEDRGHSGNVERRSMINFKEKKGFICDMDGVIYHGNILLPGVKEFLKWLVNEKKEYLFLNLQ